MKFAEESLKKGMEAKSKEFVKTGAYYFLEEFPGGLPDPQKN